MPRCVPGGFGMADWQMNTSFSLDSPASGCSGNFPLEGSPAPAVHKVPVNLLSVSQAREELLASAKIKPYIFRLSGF